MTLQTVASTASVSSAHRDHGIKFNDCILKILTKTAHEGKNLRRSLRGAVYRCGTKNDDISTTGRVP